MHQHACASSLVMVMGDLWHCLRPCHALVHALRARCWCQVELLLEPALTVRGHSEFRMRNRSTIMGCTYHFMRRLSSFCSDRGSGRPGFLQSSKASSTVVCRALRLVTKYKGAYRIMSSLSVSPWTLPNEALLACCPEDLPTAVTRNVFGPTSCPGYDFYDQHKDDPCLFGAGLIGDDGRAVPFNTLDLAARSAWFAAYLKNR